MTGSDNGLWQTLLLPVSYHPHLAGPPFCWRWPPHSRGASSHGCVCPSSLPAPVHSLQLPMGLFHRKAGFYKGCEAEHGLTFPSAGTVSGAVTSIRGVGGKQLEEARTS